VKTTTTINTNGINEYSVRRRRRRRNSDDVFKRFHMEKLKSLNKSTKKTKENNKKDAMNDAAAAAYDAVSDGVSDVKDAVGKFVQFDANKTNFFIKLRKNLDVKFPGISKEQSIIIIIIAFLLFAPRAKSLSSSSSSLFFFFLISPRGFLSFFCAEQQQLSRRFQTCASKSGRICPSSPTTTTGSWI